jgi:ectoine hydroxylase-related dioxygenase (phytanoyl-CoA dioxygenase family)
MTSSVDYMSNPWKPVPQTIINDQNLSKLIDAEGFAIRPLVSEDQLADLKQLFIRLHEMEQEDGGMFYSVYSQDLEYRKQIHEKISAILSTTVQKNFHDCRVLLNSFVVKLPGAKSEFYLHQDTTGLDEWTYSPLNLWIPLEDVDENNGCLGVIPKSHRFFTPYRSISFPAPFDGINLTVKKYLQPVRMKAGEVLVFDNRILHHSYSNLSGNTRTAVVCGMFPSEAELITCFKPQYELGGKVEIIAHEDDFLLKHPNFLIDCQSRPDSGTSLGWKDDPYHAISTETFEDLCRAHQVQKYSENVAPMGDCNLISEPI